MALLPDGRTERSVLDAELTAAKELKRVTEAYLSRVRQLYPNLPPPKRRDIVPAMKALQAAIGIRR